MSLHERHLPPLREATAGQERWNYERGIGDAGGEMIALKKSDLTDLSDLTDSRWFRHSATLQLRNSATHCLWLEKSLGSAILVCGVNCIGVIMAKSEKIAAQREMILKELAGWKLWVLVITVSVLAFIAGCVLPGGDVELGLYFVSAVLMMLVVFGLLYWFFPAKTPPKSAKRTFLRGEIIFDAPPMECNEALERLRRRPLILKIPVYSKARAYFVQFGVLGLAAFLLICLFKGYLSDDLSRGELFGLLPAILPLLALTTGIFLFMRRRVDLWSVEIKITEDGIERGGKVSPPCLLRWEELSAPTPNWLGDEIILRSKDGNAKFAIDRSYDEITLVDEILRSMIRDDSDRMDFSE